MFNLSQHLFNGTNTAHSSVRTQTPPTHMYEHKHTLLCTITNTHSSVQTQTHTHMYERKHTPLCSNTNIHSYVRTQTHPDLYEHKHTLICTNTNTHWSVRTQTIDWMDLVMIKAEKIINLFLIVTDIAIYRGRGGGWSTPYPLLL